MTDIRAKLSELRKAVEAATPRPWITDFKTGHEVWGPCGSTGSMLVARTGYAGFDSCNADAIALSRNHLPEVLDYIERLEKVVEAAKLVVNEAGSQATAYQDRLDAALDALRKETK